ncbi:flp pilus-assembly TadE/G-like family protein [Nocardioides agariphilus]|uniref:Flp pilus-assembly TadE/G-like family protein n=1 Tax=Nocardioides agariphilus TaxID=433664 RepID=A0A930VJI1_9ACTN|nr:flp pilus-assembly TadE/G-like family protein [Nocardioides agariphilus]
MTGVLMLVTGALAVMAGMFVAHRQAQAAADLAALAGAAASERGEDACHRAGAVAAANGATLDECAVEEATVTVTASVEGPSWLGQRGRLVGTARAGPVRSGRRRPRAACPRRPCRASPRAPAAACSRDGAGSRAAPRTWRWSSPRGSPRRWPGRR